MTKTALVISGGGAKGAFGVGVVKYILANTPIRFDFVCGTSTGSLITPFAALEDIATLEKVYTTTTTADIILKGDLSKRIIRNNSIFDVAPLINLVKKYYTSDVYDQLVASAKQIFFATVCLQTGQVVHFSNKDAVPAEGYEVLKLKDWDEFIKAIVASSDQPVFMQPIKIRSTDTDPRQYVDGGVREYAPVRVAIDNGATDIFVIHLSPKELKLENQEYTSIMDILMRTLGLFSHDVGENDILIPEIYNRSAIYLQAVKNKMISSGSVTAAQVESFFDLPSNPLKTNRLMKMHVFYPEYILPGPGGLEFVPADMKKYLAHGFDVAKKYFDSTQAVIA